MRWFTSDLHFYHNNVIEICNRPYLNLDAMHEGIIREWNKRIRPREEVWIFGDFVFGGKQRIFEITSRLNGRKILVKGNHDKNMASVYLECGFYDVVENEILHLIKNKNDPENNITVLTSHFPYFPVEQYFKRDGKLQYSFMGDTEKVRYPHKRILDMGQWLVHGHVHSAWRVNGKQINVGWDIWKAPVSQEQIVKIIRENPNGIMRRN